MATSALKQCILTSNASLTPIRTELEPRLRSLRGIRCVAFDVYGTLLISGSGDISTVQEDVSANLKEAILRAHAFRRQDGIEYPEVDIRAIWREILGRDEVDMHAIEYETRSNPVWPMPGMRTVLEELSGFTLGIVSNAQFYTPLTLEAFLGGSLATIGFHPEHTVWSYRELEAKPSPRLFQRLLDATGICAKETLYIGNDMLNDVWAASQLGIRTALFAGDQRSLRLREDRNECNVLEPDLVITELNQIRLCLS